MPAGRTPRAAALRIAVFALTLLAGASWPVAAQTRELHGSQGTHDKPHNVILFVADGLRHDSVNIEDAPTIYGLRHRGVDFANSHSLFPTVTTPNASALATGYGLGDTGNFANTVFVQKLTKDTDRVASAMNCDQDPRKLLFEMEDNLDLALLNCLFDGNYLGLPETLISLARKKGYNTAVVGKLGPAAIQNIAEVALSRKHPKPPALTETATAIIDGATGTGAEIDPRAADEIGNSGGFPIPSWLLERMVKADLKLTAPKGSEKGEGANLNQQKYFADIAVKAILPKFARDWAQGKKNGFSWFSGPAIPTTLNTISTTAPTSSSPASTALPQKRRFTTRTIICARFLTDWKRTNCWKVQM